MCRRCRGSHVGLRHFLWIDHSIEFGFRHKAQFKGGLLQREIIIQGVMSNLRRLVVADDRRKRRHEHQRTLHIFIDLLEVRFGTLDQELAVVRAAVGHDRARVGEIEDN